MTTPTREQVVQWAKQVTVDCVIDYYSMSSAELITFSTLARADLEAENAALKDCAADYDSKFEHMETTIAEQAAEIERLKERQDFAPDQWWVKELESIDTMLALLKYDQYRAVRIAVTAIKVSMHDNAELRQQLAGVGWIQSKDKLHPDKPGIERYEQIPCLIVRKGEILIRLWNCEHLVWDTEDGDDYFCGAEEVTHWMPLPSVK